MNLPVPEFSDFVIGFGSCAAGMAIAVAARASWPKVKALFARTESAAYADYKAAVGFLDSKITALSTAFATAVNAVRGDIKTVQYDIATVQDRLFTLEKAVGIQDPTVQASPAPSAPGPGGLSGIVAPKPLPLA